MNIKGIFWGSVTLISLVFAVDSYMGSKESELEAKHIREELAAAVQERDRLKQLHSDAVIERNSQAEALIFAENERRAIASKQNSTAVVQSRIETIVENTEIISANTNVTTNAMQQELNLERTKNDQRLIRHQSIFQEKVISQRNFFQEQVEKLSDRIDMNSDEILTIEDNFRQKLIDSQDNGYASTELTEAMRNRIEASLDTEAVQDIFQTIINNQVTNIEFVEVTQVLEMVLYPLPPAPLVPSVPSVPPLPLLTPPSDVAITIKRL